MAELTINPREITEALRRNLAGWSPSLEAATVGYVMSIGDGVARVSGLPGTMASELLEFPGGLLGVALNLDEDSIGAVIMGDASHIQEGDPVSLTGKVLSVPVGDALLGRVIDPLGNPMDGKGAIAATESRLLETQAPSVVQRRGVHQPLQTGIKAIDAMTPIGRGQRQLIIGDRQLGKTAIVVDTIINQRDSGVKCIYVAIGQKSSTVAEVVEVLERNGAMGYTVVVNAPASASPALQMYAPYAGSAIGQHWMYQGEHALVIFDDLSKQAVAYREISLLLRRPPGREAYPGDVFYLHSRLLERCAKLSDELGGGSLTGLPIVETKAGDVSAYIPTNVISITDGQIYLEGRSLLLRGPSRHQRRHLGVPGGRQRPDQGDEVRGGLAAPQPGPVPRVGGVRRASAPISMPPPRPSWTGVGAWSRCSSSRSTGRCRWPSRWCRSMPSPTVTWTGCRWSASPSSSSPSPTTSAPAMPPSSSTSRPRAPCRTRRRSMPPSASASSGSSASSDPWPAPNSAESSDASAAFVRR